MLTSLRKKLAALILPKGYHVHKDRKKGWKEPKIGTFEYTPPLIPKEE